jgi:hypothetical protein
MPVTLYVDADDGAASDAWTHAQAADDPTKPFLTMQAAAMLLQAGDTMQVEPSTLGNANPADARGDFDVYAGIHITNGTTQLPAALNGAGATINVVGHIVGDVRPKILELTFFELDNWAFEGFQVGYDRDSGDDYSTVSLLHNCKDLTFTDMVWTGGAYYCISGRGTLHFDQSTCYSPLVDTGSFLDGAGFHLLGFDTSTGLDHPCIFRFTDCWFENVEGEDCIQAALGDPAWDDHLEVIGCTFKDIFQSGTPGAAHTDCIQTTGATTVTVVGNRFINSSSPFIASDGLHDRITFIRNLIDGIGNGFFAQGCAELVVVQNTIICPGVGVVVGDRANQSNPAFVQKLTIVNNLAGDLGFEADIVVDEDSVVTNNVLYRQPGSETPWGTQLDALPELGSSLRLAEAGLTGDYELANDPTESVGIGDGRALAGLDLTSDEITYAATDYLGRAFATPRDTGAFQSDPGTLVTAAARAPYVLNKTPLGNGAALDADMTARFFPKPGKEINAATVTTSSAYVTDVAGGVLPAVVTLSDPDEDGYQTLTLNIKSDLSPLTDGSLYPLVLYTAHLTTAIEDTEGSAIIATSWDFRGVGPAGPAVGDPVVDTGSIITIETGSEAGAILRRLAAAITAAALPLPDSNPTGSPVVLVFTVDPVSGQRAISLSGGSLSGTQTVIVI